MENLIIMAAVILLPVIPACILFLIFPTRAAVEGPWNRLNIKLTGAFGGYFLILVILVGSFRYLNREAPRLRDEVQRLKEIESQANKVYTVKGNISADDMSSFEGEKVDDFTVVVIPTTWRIYRGGGFEAQIPVGHKPDGTPDFPGIGVKHPDYSGYDVDLDNPDLIDQNHERREISLRQPIKLRKNTVGYGAEGSQQPKETPQ